MRTWIQGFKNINTEVPEILFSLVLFKLPRQLFFPTPSPFCPHFRKEGEEGARENEVAPAEATLSGAVLEAPPTGMIITH